MHDGTAETLSQSQITKHKLTAFLLNLKWSEKLQRIFHSRRSITIKCVLALSLQKQYIYHSINALQAKVIIVDSCQIEYYLREIVFYRHLEHHSCLKCVDSIRSCHPSSGKIMCIIHEMIEGCLTQRTKEGKQSNSLIKPCSNFHSFHFLGFFTLCMKRCIRMSITLLFLCTFALQPAELLKIYRPKQVRK